METTVKASPSDPLNQQIETSEAGGGLQYTDLLLIQNATGGWDLNEALASVLSLSLEDMQHKCPAATDALAWGTALGLAWLKSYCRSFKAEWALIEAKALNVLQSIVGFQHIDKLVAEASLLFP